LITLLIASPVPAATVEVHLVDFRFTPNDITINAGDTVRWVNQQGFHNVVADNGSFRSGNPASQPWTFERVFNQTGEVRYYCEVHSGPGQNINTAMNGRINVVAAAPAFAINQGISGAWFNPATAGQGFLIDIRPSDQFIFIAWFTYEKAAGAVAGDSPKVGSSEQRWLTAQGNYSGGTANLPIFLTAGGAFNDPRTTTTTQVGTMAVNFTSCTAGSIAFTLTSDSLTGSIPIQRVIPGTESLCQMLAQ
jgi:plastocyanin